MFIPTGAEQLDHALGGGVKSGEVTLIYGGGGSGKTVLALQIVAECCRRSLKTVLAVGGGSFPLDRFIQLTGSEWRDLLEYCLVNQLRDFDHQDSFVSRLDSYLSLQTRLVVFDSFTSLYRVALTPQRGTPNVDLNRLLNRELALLAWMSREKDLCVLLTSEMRSIPSIAADGRSGEEAVGTTLLTYWSPISVKLESSPKLNTKKCTVINSVLGAAVAELELTTGPTGIR